MIIPSGPVNELAPASRAFIVEKRSMTNRASMDFRGISSLNLWMNLLSGNLLPMTGDNSSFPMFWRVYCVFSWLIVLAFTGSLITGFIFLPRKKAIKDGMISLVVVIEILVIIIRLNTQRGLVRKLIRQVNRVLSVPDEVMRNVLATILKSMKAALQFYWISGAVAIIVWCFIPVLLLFQKSSFNYVDLQSPMVYAKEPYTRGEFIFIVILMLLNNLYLFFKKVAMDIYITHLVLLVTAQHRYTAVRLVSIFRDGNRWYDQSHAFRRNSKQDCVTVKELKVLCEHHISTINLTLILKQLLSLSFSLIYVIGVFRFCSITIMLFSILSSPVLEGLAVSIFACSEVVQLYIICYCSQKLLEASTNITNEAFHEDWHRFGSNVKRIFILIIMYSNMGFQLSTFNRFNLSLPSFMTILNQSYSIALLILRLT